MSTRLQTRTNAQNVLINSAGKHLFEPVGSAEMLLADTRLSLLQLWTPSENLFPSPRARIDGVHMKNLCFKLEGLLSRREIGISIIFFSFSALQCFFSLFPARHFIDISAINKIIKCCLSRLALKRAILGIFHPPVPFWNRDSIDSVFMFVWKHIDTWRRPRHRCTDGIFQF